MEKVAIKAEKTKLNGRDGYRWAWKESAEKKVYGFAVTTEEIERRAKRFFPDKEIELVVL